MYYIITNSKEIYDFAKKKGAKVLSADESVILDDAKITKSPEKLLEEDKECEVDIIDNFFNRFPEINKNTLGYKCVKYILKNKIRITVDTRYEVYEQLAKEFDKRATAIATGITILFEKICERRDFKPFLDEIRKNPKARYYNELAAEFIRLLGEKYINNNCLVNEKKFNANIIKEFFDKFLYVNTNTLGYECVKYILRKGIDCTGNYEKTIYPILAKKFKTKVKIIKQSMTYFLNNCRYNARFGMPEDFKKFYHEHNHVDARKTIEENNFAFISLCRNYLESVC